MHQGMLWGAFTLFLSCVVVADMRTIPIDDPSAIGGQIVLLLSNYWKMFDNWSHINGEDENELLL
jgi:hypothetical protein